MYPIQEEQDNLQQALYYLNNRHQLKMQDMPKYIQALELADRCGLVSENGRWYLPTAE
jgi:hypothetical protein